MKRCNVNCFCKAQHQKFRQLIPWESNSVFQTPLLLGVEIPWPFTCLYLPFSFSPSGCAALHLSFNPL